MSDEKKDEEEKGSESFLAAWRKRRADLHPITYGLPSPTAPFPPGESPAGPDGQSQITGDPEAGVRTMRRRPIGGPLGQEGDPGEDHTIPNVRPECLPPPGSDKGKLA